MKKFASYILLAAMMLSILTGCGGVQANKSEQEGATKTGTIKFTISTDGAIRSRVFCALLGRIFWLADPPDSKEANHQGSHE